MEAVVLASAWYPVSFLLALMKAAKKEFGAEMPDIVTQIGRASADYAHTTVYKLVFKVGSPSGSSSAGLYHLPASTTRVRWWSPRKAHVRERRNAGFRRARSRVLRTHRRLDRPHLRTLRRQECSTPPTSRVFARATRSAGLRGQGLS